MLVKVEMQVMILVEMPDDFNDEKIDDAVAGLMIDVSSFDDGVDLQQWDTSLLNAYPV